MSNTQRFLTLFKGNNRSFGQFNPKTKKMITVEKTSTLANFEKHMSGDIGMGVVPVTDEGTCYFAAIDIDNHSGEVINHKEIHSQIFLQILI